MSKKTTLTRNNLLETASQFADVESKYYEPTLFGVTDGKAVGTYLEHKFKEQLKVMYEYEPGNSASGIDIPALGVDIKVTSVRQPQSSCPYRDAIQKIYGLGYDLLIFVYEKTDDHLARTSCLNILHTVFVEKEVTADFQLTRGINEILDQDGNTDDLIAFMQDKMLPVDDIRAKAIAEELIRNRPKQGYLTISNALQWRLQYNRVIKLAGETEGIQRIR